MTENSTERIILNHHHKWLGAGFIYRQHGNQSLVPDPKNIYKKVPSSTEWLKDNERNCQRDHNTGRSELRLKGHLK
jgi:hypothetical protein